MGNACCGGRTHNPTTTNTGDAFSKASALNPKVNQSNPSKLQYINNPSDLKQNFNSRDHKPESNEDFGYFGKSNTVKVHSNCSESQEALSYSLITSSEFDQFQQSELLKLLDNYKAYQSVNDIEVIDGFVYIEENNVKCLLMITTHALYYLQPIDLKLIRRITLEDITYIILPLSQNFLIISLRDLDKTPKMTCDDMENLLKSIQQMSYEAFRQYIPWVIVSKPQDLTMKIDESSLFNDQKLAIVKAIVEHGRIGEEEILVELCANSGDTKMMNVLFVMTNIAIYSLDSSYGFMKRFLIDDIDKISISSKDKYVKFYEVEGTHEFLLPRYRFDTIKSSFKTLGAHIKIIES